MTCMYALNQIIEEYQLPFSTVFTNDIWKITITITIR